MKDKHKETRVGKHRPGKRQHTWWCFDSQWEALCRAADRHGMNASGLITAIADGTLYVKEVEK